MPRLPTSNDLTSNSGALVPASAAQNSGAGGRAIGQAVKNLGDDMVATGVAWRAAEDKSRYNEARSSLIVIDMEERRRAMEEQPYQNWETSYRDNYEKRARPIIDGLRSKADQQLLDSSFQVDKERGGGAMFGAAFSKETDSERAVVFNNLTKMNEAAAMATGLGDFEPILENALASVDAGVESNYFSSVEGEGMKGKIKNGMAIDYIDLLPDERQIAELKNDKGIAQFLDEGVRKAKLKAVTDAYEPRRRSIAAESFTTEAWGNGDTPMTDLYKETRKKFAGKPEEMELALKMLDRLGAERNDAANELQEQIIDAGMASETAEDGTRLNRFGNPVRDILTDPLNSDELMLLRHNEQQAIIAFYDQGGFPKTTDQPWFTPALNEFHGMSRKEKAAEYDRLPEYALHLSEGDYVVMRDMVFEAKFGGGYKIENLDSALGAFNTRFGKREDNDNEDYNALYDDYKSRFFEAQQQKGAKLEDPEIQELLDQSFRKVVLHEVTWYGRDIAYNAVLLKPENIDYSEINKEFIDDAKAAAPNASPNQIREWYADWLKAQPIGYSDTYDPTDPLQNAGNKGGATVKGKERGPRSPINQPEAE